MAEQLVDLTLHRAPGGAQVGEVYSVQLDPEFADTKRLREIFCRLAAEAEGERVRQELEDMPWLADYVLEIREHGAERLLFTYREFGA